MRKLFGVLLILFAPTLAMSATVTVVISGLGGNAEYDEQFEGYATSIAEQARLTADSPQDVILVRGTAAKRNVLLSLLENLPVSNNADVFIMYLIGHGTFDGDQYKFNIPGPDITDTELAAALTAIKSPKQLVVVATSASGALLDALAADNRVVITATKNAREKNAVRFPQYMVEALTDRTADLNKDESISAKEFFDYTERAVASYFETEKLLAPEHARIIGDLADSIEVSRYGTLLERKEEIPAALMAKRQSLTSEISALRSRKNEVDEDTYFDTLQTLMLELAEIQKTIDDGGVNSAN